jgi:hypothetical protein
VAISFNKGWTQKIPPKIKNCKNSDKVTIHWKALGEHFLITIKNLGVKYQFPEMFSKYKQPLPLAAFQTAILHSNLWFHVIPPQHTKQYSMYYTFLIETSNFKCRRISYKFISHNWIQWILIERLIQGELNVRGSVWVYHTRENHTPVYPYLCRYPYRLRVRVLYFVLCDDLHSDLEQGHASKSWWNVDATRKRLMQNKKIQMINAGTHWWSPQYIKWVKVKCEGHSEHWDHKGQGCSSQKVKAMRMS